MNEKFENEKRGVHGFGKEETIIVDTSSDLEDGQTKCEKCGSTEISLNPTNGNLRCHFCRHEQIATKVEKFVTDISQLEGQVIGSGASDIIADIKDQLTFKCGSCASEVVIDTSEAQQARCHWCRQTLSVNQQIPNGAIPDKVLPFSIRREDAVRVIDTFVGNRKFFAHKTFKEDFKPENVMGVYLPYMVIDVNSHGYFEGEATHTIRTYTETNENIERTYKDVDTYQIERDFDLIVEDLTIEANSEKLNHRSLERTNNIVNAIKPFDVENSVAWDANYMTGFTSQKRDINVETLSALVKDKAEDIAINSVMNETMTSKSRGVKWIKKDMTFKGKQWRSAYLPVWIYSYQLEKSETRSKIHYIAVNGRSQKAMGSVPLDMTKLIIFSLLLGLLFILPGLIFFFVIKGRYRNAWASHDFIRETTRRMENLISNDTLIRQDKRVFVSERRFEEKSNETIEQKNVGAKKAAVAAMTVSGTEVKRSKTDTAAKTKLETKDKESRSKSVSKHSHPSSSKTSTKTSGSSKSSTTSRSTFTQPKNASTRSQSSPSKTSTKTSGSSKSSTTSRSTSTQPKNASTRSQSSPSKTSTKTSGSSKSSSTTSRSTGRRR